AHVDEVVGLDVNVRIFTSEDAVEVHGSKNFLVRTNPANDFGARGNSNGVKHAGGGNGRLEGDALADDLVNAGAVDVAGDVIDARRGAGDIDEIAGLDNNVVLHVAVFKGTQGNADFPVL